MSKQFLAVIAAIIVLFVGLSLWGSSDNKDGSKSSSSTTALTQHISGKGTTGVTLVEYADYQCPYCEQYYPTLKQVQAAYGDQIKFQFRNFPLVNAHQNAFAAARAAEAADQQGKFWEMHDLLYDTANWNNWTVASNPNKLFDQYASQLSLDVTKFKQDFGSDKVNSLINNDEKEGTRLNIQGTPSFFLDGKQVQIPNSFDSFKKVIDAEIAKKKPAATSTQPTESTVTDTSAVNAQ